MMPDLHSLKGLAALCRERPEIRWHWYGPRLFIHFPEWPGRPLTFAPSFSQAPEWMAKAIPMARPMARAAG